MHHSIRTIFTAALMLLFLNGAVLAQAVNPNDQPAKSAAKKKPAKAKSAKKSVKTKFSSGSEESSAERSARLKRECKGGVNAGVCTGYTR